MKNNWYRGVAVVSKLTVYDVCNFKPTVFDDTKTISGVAVYPLTRF